MEKLLWQWCGEGDGVADVNVAGGVAEVAVMGQCGGGSVRGFVCLVVEAPEGRVAAGSARALSAVC